MKKKFLRVLGILLFIAAGCMACGKTNAKDPTPSGEGEEWSSVEKTPVQPDAEEPWADASDEGLVLEGEVLTGLVRVGEDGAYYCNAEENVRVAYGMEDFYRSNKVCRDAVYGITYFVNYGRDYFIYALRDGESIPVVRLPTTEIYCREGKVYFILLSPGKNAYSLKDSGPVACYDPENGKITIVTTQPANRITVYPDGIYLKYLLGTDETGFGTAYDFSYFFYSFKEKTLEQRTAAGIDRVCGKLVNCVYGKLPEDSHAYLVNGGGGYGVTGYEFLDAGEARVGRLETLPYSQGTEGMFRILGETMYCLEMEYGSKEWKPGDGLPDEWHVFSAYHLDSGEREELCRLKNLPSTVYGSDFILHNGVVYFAGAVCVRMEPADGSCSIFRPGEVGNTMEMAWFTDGGDLFFYSGKRLYLYHETKREGDRFHQGETIDGKECYWDYDVEFIPLGK